jgi:hypothetical protein
MTEKAMRGDRSAYDVDNYPEKHASDINAGNALYHLPTPENADYFLTDDGDSWVERLLLNTDLPNPICLLASTEKQLSGGAITVDKSYHTVKSEDGNPDDLVTINGGLDRQILILMARATETITIKHDSGNIFRNGLTDFVLTGTKKIALFYDEVNTKWSDIGAGGGGGGAVATDAIWDALGDIAAGTGADTAARLPVGADGQVLTANAAEATGLKWADAGSGDMANDALWGAKGDIAIGAANNSGDVLAVGANGKRIVADSAETLGMKWDYDALYVGQTGFLVNEIMNFPSLEKANDTKPEWWETADTLIEVDIAGEGITETFERALKFTNSDPGEYSYQMYTYADQQRIKAGRKLSAIVAVWSVGAVEAKISLVSSVGVLGTSTGTTTAGWTILKVEDVTLDGTWVILRFEVANGTAYFVPLGVNIGSKALALPPRGLRYQAIDSTLVLDLAGHGDDAAWTDEDVTAETSNLAVIAKLRFIFRISAASTEFAFDIRRNGSSKALAIYEALGFCRGDSNKEMRITYDAILDDGQVFEYILDRTTGAGTVSIGNLFVDGYYEWE